MKLKTVLRRMRKNKLFMTGFIMMFTMVLLCATAELWIYWDEEVGSLRDRLVEPDYFANGLRGHPFGTDALGRDLLSRLFVGGWNSLKIAVVVTVLSMTVGALVGIACGY